MKALRRIIGDRLAGGVLSAMVGYFLLLQAFVAALACGMTIPVESAPRFVICEAAQAFAAASPAHEDDAPAFGHSCPCVVCHAGDVGLTAALAPDNDIGPAFGLRTDAVPPAVEATGSPVDPSALGLAPEARGPPPVSA